jgi:hypothetical protein
MKPELDIQELLDLEAQLANTRYTVHQVIKELRGKDHPPCWGEDDCSTLILSRCPWRIDCGEDQSNDN